jgi:3-oxoacyl-[acyl-carrier protein] reductase
MNRDSARETDPKRKKELSGKAAVVTGASGGIGRVVALELARAGADVMVHGFQNAASAQQVAREVEALGVRSHVEIGDLSVETDREQLIARAWNWSEAIDIWINLAGADVLTGSLASASFEQKLRQLWRIDVEATIWLARRAGRRMYEHGGGVILNVGWDQAWHGMSHDSGEMFAAVKGAVMCFSLSLAKSLSPHVRVNCLAPGWIKTSWAEQASAEWHRRARRESLRDRWGLPEDVARVARFLSSPDAEFINGQIVNVNGGFRHGPWPTS